MVARGMDNGLVDRCRVVALAMVDLVGLSIVRVLDVHDGARVLVGHGVGHSLKTAIGKGNMVTAISGVAVPGLIGTKLNWVLVVVVGVDAILVLVVGRAVLGLFVGGGVVGGLMDGGVVGGGVHVGGKGDGQEGGKGDEDLKRNCLNGVTSFKFRPSQDFKH